MDASVAAAIVMGSFALLGTIVSGWRLVVTERATKESHASSASMTEAEHMVQMWKDLYFEQKAEAAEMRVLLLEERHQHAECKERCAECLEREQEWLDKVEWIRESEGDDSTDGG